MALRLLGAVALGLVLLAGVSHLTRAGLPAVAVAKGGARRLGQTLPRGASSVTEAKCNATCPDCSWRSSPTRPFDRVKDYVLLYSYGKVGTSTLQNSFGKLMGSRIPFGKLNQVKKWKPVRGRKFHEVKAARAFLQKAPKGSHVWIVTGTRNPFAQSVSWFFQRMPGIFQRIWREAHHEDKSTPKTSLEGVSLEDVMTQYVVEAAHSSSHVHPEDNERFLKGYFQDLIQFDLTACSYHLQDGVLYAERTMMGVHLHIMLLRLEDVKQWQEIMAIFAPGFELGGAQNVADNKSLADLYSNFKQEWTWTEADVTRFLMWDTWAFYSKAERDAIVQALPMRAGEN